MSKDQKVYENLSSLEQELVNKFTELSILLNDSLTFNLENKKPKTQKVLIIVFKKFIRTLNGSDGFVSSLLNTDITKRDQNERNTMD